MSRILLWKRKKALLAFTLLAGVMPAGMTFARPTVAGYWDVNAVYQTAAVDAPRFDYDPSSLTENLVTYSEDFSQWAAGGTAAIVGASSLAPDGNVMTVLTDNSTGGVANIQRTYNTSIGVSYTLSFRVLKDAVPAATRTCFVSVDNNKGICFSTNVGGIFAQAGTAGVIDNGTYWTFTFVFTAANATQVVALQPARYNALNASTNPAIVGSMTIWGVQLARTAMPSARYAKTTASTYSGCLMNGLLFEGNRTNLWGFSENLTTAVGGTGVAGLTVTAGQAGFIDGTSNFNLLVEDASTNQHIVNKSFTYISGQIYSMSYFVKDITRRYVQLAMSGTGFNGSTCYANFDLQTGTVTQVGGAAGTFAFIDKCGIGIYRISIQGTASASVTGGSGIILIDSPTAGFNPTRTGDGSSSLYASGAQMEGGSTATSYMKNADGTNFARGTDTLDSGTNYAGSIRDYGTHFCEFTFSGIITNGAQAFYSIQGTTGNNRVTGIKFNSGQTMRQEILSNGSTASSASTGIVPTAKTRYKWNTRCKKDDFAVTLNGANLATDTSGNVPVGLYRFAFGGGNTAYAWLRTFGYTQEMYSNTRLLAQSA